jgi:hypothetical protein
MTTYNQEYNETVRKGIPGKLDSQMAKDLRSHHTNIGQGNQDWNTSYRQSHNQNMINHKY